MGKGNNPPRPTISLVSCLPVARRIRPYSRASARNLPTLPIPLRTRLLDILHDYPQAWARMLIKRAYRHAGIPDAQMSEDQIEAARRADIMCHHPRMANIMGLPFHGVIYSEPLRTRTAP